jgi:hypothetical protein
VAVDAVLVAESDDGVGEPRSLLRGVDLFRDGGECGPAPAGVDVLDCFADALKVGTDAPGSARSIGAVRLIGRLVRLTTGLSGHLIPEVAQHLGRRRLTAQLLAQPSRAREHG